MSSRREALLSHWLLYRLRLLRSLQASRKQPTMRDCLQLFFPYPPHTSATAEARRIQQSSRLCAQTPAGDRGCKSSPPFPLLNPWGCLRFIGLLRKRSSCCWRTVSTGFSSLTPSPVLPFHLTCPLSPLKIWASLPSASALSAKDGWHVFKGLHAFFSLSISPSLPPSLPLLLSFIGWYYCCQLTKPWDLALFCFCLLR